MSLPTNGSATGEVGSVGADLFIRRALLDALAFAKSDPEHPQDGLSNTELFARVSVTIYGHAPIAEAIRQGYFDRDTGRLEQTGKRLYFAKAVAALVADGELVLDTEGLIHIGSVRDGYVPGSDKRSVVAHNLSNAARELLAHLDEVIPPMGPQDYAELTQSMKWEGFDDAHPVVRDTTTGMILDGRARVAAAAEAGVAVTYFDVECANDLERLRYAIRGNLMRRGIRHEKLQAIEHKLRERHLTTREMARILGYEPIKLRGKRVVASAPQKPLVNGSGGSKPKSKQVVRRPRKPLASQPQQQTALLPDEPAEQPHGLSDFSFGGAPYESPGRLPHNVRWGIPLNVEEREDAALDLYLATDTDGYSLHANDHAVALTLSAKYQVEPPLSTSTIYYWVRNAAARRGMVTLPKRSRRPKVKPAH